MIRKEMFFVTVADEHQSWGSTVIVAVAHKHDDALKLYGQTLKEFGINPNDKNQVVENVAAIWKGESGVFAKGNILHNCTKLLASDGN